MSIGRGIRVRCDGVAVGGGAGGEWGWGGVGGEGDEGGVACWEWGARVGMEGWRGHDSGVAGGWRCELGWCNGVA